MSTLSQRLGNFFFPDRLKPLRAWFWGFLIVNALVRIGLAIFNGDMSVFTSLRIVPVLLVGLLFDVGVSTFFLMPIVMISSLWPKRAFRGLQWFLWIVLAFFSVTWVFTGFSEFTFWNEFASRFNFIAVDYLVYTNEVIGNINESYNMPLLLSCVAVLSVLVGGLIGYKQKKLANTVAVPAPKNKPLTVGFWLVAPVIAFYALNASYKEKVSENAQFQELAGNGYFDFFHAFRVNELDYSRFYKMQPQQEVVADLKKNLDVPFNDGQSKQIFLSADKPYNRFVQHTGPEKRYNVVMVSVESLSASFFNTFGNTQGITPHLDQLAKEGMLFTQLYATGTRTVRGLEALSMSFPPTPGFSVVKRPDNADLFTMSHVFRNKGYDTMYLYGGYSYFDNMPMQNLQPNKIS